jgi:hypothetical protein
MQSENEHCYLLQYNLYAPNQILLVIPLICFTENCPVQDQELLLVVMALWLFWTWK